MTMGDGFSEFQQPGDGYGPVWGEVFDYTARVDKPKAAPVAGSGAPQPPVAATPAPTPTPSAPDHRKTAADLVAELAHLYRKRYSKPEGRARKSRRITLGPDIGNVPRIDIIADSDFTQRLKEHATFLFEEFVKAKVSFDPQSVQDKLIRVYELRGEKIPYGLPISHRTVLNNRDKTELFLIVKILIESRLQKESDDIQGFFQNTGGTGTVFIRESLFSDSLTRSELVTTLSHELAHAYASDIWDSFLNDMSANGLKRVSDLDEGMSTELGHRIAMDWFDAQPASANLLVPSKPYAKDQWDIAEQFIREVTESKALEAYFGGHIRPKDENEPKGPALVGKNDPRTWTWPWR